MRRLRRRACERKKRFKNIDEAQRDAASYNRTKYGGIEVMFGYACTFCGSSHTGHRRTEESEKYQSRLSRRDRRLVPIERDAHSPRRTAVMPVKFTPRRVPIAEDMAEWERFASAFDGNVLNRKIPE